MRGPRLSLLHLIWAGIIMVLVVLPTISALLAIGIGLVTGLLSVP